MKFRRCLILKPIMVLMLISLQIFVLLPATVSAASNSTFNEDRPFPTEVVDETKADATNSTNIGWTLVKLVFSLLLIILLAYLIIRVFGKQVNRRFRGRYLQVVDELIIGPNRGVVLVEMGGRILALGVTDHSINVLFEVNDEHLIKEMLAATPDTSEEWSQLSAMKNVIDRIKTQRSSRFENNLNQWLDETPDNSKERGHRQ